MTTVFLPIWFLSQLVNRVVVSWLAPNVRARGAAFVSREEIMLYGRCVSMRYGSAKVLGNGEQGARRGVVGAAA